MSKVATAKLPSLIQLSAACASCINLRKAGTFFSVQCGCQTASSEMTGTLVQPPSCRARVVLPVPAQPRMTIRAMIGFAGNFLWKLANSHSFVLVKAVRLGGSRLLQHHPSYAVFLLQARKVFGSKVFPRTLRPHLRPPLVGQRGEHADD